MTKHTKQTIYKMLSWGLAALLILVTFETAFVPQVRAATSGQMTMYLHKENSDANEAYNSTGLTPPEPAADTATGTSPIVFVQSKSANGSSAAPAATYTNSPVGGDLLVAFVGSAGGTTITMTSAGWTAGTAAGGTGGSARQVRIFWKIAANTGESSTVTAAAANNNWVIAIAEYSGVDRTTPLDGAVGSTGENAQANASGTNTTPSITPTASKSALAVSGLYVKTNTTYSSQAISGTNGVTLNTRETPATTNATATLFDKTISSTSGAYQGSATPGANAIGGGSIAIFQAAAQSERVVNASPATNFCEATSNVTDNINQVSVDAASTGERCVATFISQPLVGSAGGTISLATGDTASVTGQFWASESNSLNTVAPTIYIYRWNASGTSVSSGDRIATITCADPGTGATSCAPSAVAPANNVTFNAGDRLVVIMSISITVAQIGSSASAYYDSTGRTATYVRMGYTTYGYDSTNKPTLSGTLDEDFTTDAATTACSTTDNTTHYNTKWTCVQGSATNTAGNFNAASSSSPSGDSTGWLWLQNQTTNTSATVSNFGSTPSNTFLYQPLSADYGDGDVTTVINSSVFYDIGATPTNSASPYSHSGLVLWTSNTDYIEVQVYSDGAINDSGTNKVHVALNNAGSISGAQNLDSATTGNGFSNIWVRFANTAGSYQAQYSTNGASFTNVGTAVTHNAFKRVGLNAFAAIANPIMSYAGAFEWFASTLAAATYNQDAYIWDDYADNVVPGTALAANNTPFSLTSAGQKFRLRLDLKITGQSNKSNTPPQFKLQYVGKGSGTCAAPSGGTPSSYTDVTASTVIAYYNSATPTDEDNITTQSGKDPTGGGTNIAQTYQELNNFSASQTDLNNGDDGLWDFSLIDNTAPAGTTYCFKVVTSGGADITTYTNYAEITSFQVGPTTDQILRGGEWFNGGSKQPFYWTN